MIVIFFLINVVHILGLVDVFEIYFLSKSPQDVIVRSNRWWHQGIFVLNQAEKIVPIVGVNLLFRG